MSRTPAAGLARLKVAFPEWSFRRTASGGYTARRTLPGGLRQIAHGATLASLEHQLRLIERGESPD